MQHFTDDAHVGHVHFRRWPGTDQKTFAQPRKEHGKRCGTNPRPQQTRCQQQQGRGYAQHAPARAQQRQRSPDTRGHAQAKPVEVEKQARLPHMQPKRRTGGKQRKGQQPEPQGEQWCGLRWAFIQGADGVEGADGVIGAAGVDGAEGAGATPGVAGLSRGCGSPAQPLQA